MVDVCGVDDHLLHPGVAETAEPVDQLVGGFGCGPPSVGGEQAHRLQGGAFDLLEWSAHRLAVLGEDPVLVTQLVGIAEQVGSIGVLGDETQRLLLPASADHDRHPGSGDRLGHVEQPLGA